MSTSADLIVVGAGPAGLMAAWRASKSGRSVIVLERASAVGGMAASFSVAGVRVDHGSHRLHPSTAPEIMADLRGLVGDDLQTRPRHGRFRVGDRWVGFPCDRRTWRGRCLPRRSHGSAPTRSPRRCVATMRRPATPTRCAAVSAHVVRPAVRTVRAQALGQAGRGDRPRTGAGAGAGGHRVEDRGPVAAQAEGRCRAGVPLPAPRFRADRGRRRGCGRRQRREARTRRRGDRDPARPRRGRGQDRGRRTSDRGPHVHHGTADTACRPRVPDRTTGCRRRRGQTDVPCHGPRLSGATVWRDRWTEFDATYLPDAGTPISRISEPTNYRVSEEDPIDRTVLCCEIPCSADPHDPVWSASQEQLADLVADTLARVGLPPLRLDGPDAVHVRRVRMSIRSTRRATPRISVGSTNGLRHCPR